MMQLSTLGTQPVNGHEIFLWTELQEFSSAWKSWIAFVVAPEALGMAIMTQPDVLWTNNEQNSRIKVLS